MTERRRKPSNDYNKVFAYPTPEDGFESPDGKWAKRYPNGIAITAAALLQHWPWIKGRNLKGHFGTKLDFSEAFGDEYEKIDSNLRNTYPGNSSHKKDLASDLHDIATFETKNLSYMQLRRLADLLGLPLSLFILFTELVSLERRLLNSTRRSDLTVEQAESELFEYLKLAKDFVDSSKQSIEEGVTLQTFHRIFQKDECKAGKGKTLKPSISAEEAYLCDLGTLQKLIEALTSTQPARNAKDELDK